MSCSATPSRMRYARLSPTWPTQRPLGPQDQGGAGGAQAAELGVLLADGVDAGVGLVERPAEGRDDAVAGVLQVEEGDVADGLGAGLLADRVAAHAVGDDEHVPVRREPGRVHRRAGGAGVLVVAPLDAHVGQGGVSDRFECRHEPPRT